MIFFGLFAQCNLTHSALSYVIFCLAGDFCFKMFPVSLKWVNKWWINLWVGDSLLHIKDTNSSTKSVKHSHVNWYWATLPLLFLTKDLLPYSSHSHHSKFSVSSGCLFPPLVLLCQLSKTLPRKTESLIERYLLPSLQTKWIKTCHIKLLVCYLSLILWALQEPLTCWIVWKIKAHNVYFLHGWNNIPYLEL